MRLQTDDHKTEPYFSIVVTNLNFKQATAYNEHHYCQNYTLLRRLVAGFSQRRPVSVHVEFVEDKVALTHVLLQVLQLSPVNIIQPILYTHVSSWG
jgi:hypothetical protein